MKFSVIIPTYNDWFRVMKCLNALENQTLGKERYEVIVVDNSEDGIIPEDIDLPEFVKFSHEPTPGSYAARNKGAEIAKGDILAFTDSDCIPSMDWLLNAEKVYKDTKTDLIGGKIEIFKANEGNECAYIYDNHTAFPQHRDVPLGRGVTANLFVKRAVFEEVGGFDPKIKSGGDWEFTLKCTEMGFMIIYNELVVVSHPARNSLSNIFRKVYRLTCWGAINVKKKYGHSQLRILGSYLFHGLNHLKKSRKTELNRKERKVILLIEILTYFYRASIHFGILLRLVNPYKVRE